MGVPVVVVGVVTLALFGAGANVHPANAATHTTTSAETAREYGDRRAGWERIASDGRPPPGCVGVVICLRRSDVAPGSRSCCEHSELGVAPRQQRRRCDRVRI